MKKTAYSLQLGIKTSRKSQETILLSLGAIQLTHGRLPFPGEKTGGSGPPPNPCREEAGEVEGSHRSVGARKEKRLSLRAPHDYNALGEKERTPPWFAEEEFGEKGAW